MTNHMRVGVVGSRVQGSGFSFGHAKQANRPGEPPATHARPLRLGGTPRPTAFGSDMQPVQFIPIPQPG
ncbi:MAG: hypothetical protein WCP12_02830 [bacterium]